MPVAVDFESTYDKRDLNIGALGVYPYLRHPDCEIYLVSIVDDDVAWVGHPIDAPWEKINGRHWVSHNAAFDRACLDVLQEQGYVSESVEPSLWDCTANLSVFLGGPRSLAAACAVFLGIAVDKSTRDKMAGQRWTSMTEEFRQEAKDYALADSVNCRNLWVKESSRFIPFELALSRHTLAMTRRGIGVDVDAVEAGLSVLSKELWNLQQLIPWADTLDAKGKEVPITSPKALRAECVKRSISPPSTTNAKSDAFNMWLDKHGETADFVKALQGYRSVNRTIEVLKKLRAQTNAEGRLSYSLKYFGGHTGRWSGDAGLNFQNFPKKPVCGVDLRGCLVPGEGAKFIVADLSQIEARVALWLAGDTKMLALCESMDLYEAHARATMGYTDPRPLEEVDNDMRQLAKCRVLGLGFGLGHVKFMQIAKEWAGIILSKEESAKIVADYRNKNWRIVDLWRSLEQGMKHWAGRKEPFTIELPSGRVLSYFDVKHSIDPVFKKEGITTKVEQGGHPLHYYGGKLFENVVQATARDILAAAVLRLEFAGHPVVLHVHDEVICEVPEGVSVDAIKTLMATAPAWADDLPIACKAHEADRYIKK